QEFIAGATGGITVTCFFCSENRVADTGGVQDLCESNRYALVPVVERSGASNPKENLWLFAFRYEFGNGWDCHRFLDQLKRSAGENFHGAKLVSTFWNIA